MSVIDDHIAEDHKEAVYFEIGVYSLGQQNVLSDARIYIEDNDGRSIIHTCVVTSTIANNPTVVVFCDSIRFTI